MQDRHESHGRYTNIAHLDVSYNDKGYDWMGFLGWVRATGWWFLNGESRT